MKFAIVLAAAVATLTPALVSAEPKAAPAPSESTGTPVSAPTSARPKPTRYCYFAETTGTRIAQKICQTREEWKREGIEVPANL